MTTITIKYTSDIPFKYVHDLIMENEGCTIEFEEIEDEVNSNSVFEIANLCQDFGKDKFSKLVFISPKDTLTDNMSLNTYFRGIPFNEVKLADKIFYFNV
jgi:hypothetical protein